MEWLAILIFILIVVLAPFVFVGWVIYSVVRLVATGISQNARTASGAALPGHTVRCPTNACLAVNPADARFCRRCGHGLPAAHRVQVRRAAVW